MNLYKPIQYTLFTSSYIDAYELILLMYKNQQKEQHTHIIFILNIYNGVHSTQSLFYILLDRFPQHAGRGNKLKNA